VLLHLDKPFHWLQAPCFVHQQLTAPTTWADVTSEPLPAVCPCPAAVYDFAEKFMLWSAFQALVMLVQNRYQKRRMYTRIAMGKNSAMDVVSGESSGSAGQLMVLYPMLFRKLPPSNNLLGVYTYNEVCLGSRYCKGRSCWQWLAEFWRVSQPFQLTLGCICCLVLPLRVCAFMCPQCFKAGSCPLV
jgi:hypothetical protein